MIFFGGWERKEGTRATFQCCPFGSSYFLFIYLFVLKGGGGGRERETSERSDAHLWIRTREESDATDAIPVAIAAAHTRTINPICIISHTSNRPRKSVPVRR